MFIASYCIRSLALVLIMLPAAALRAENVPPNVVQIEAQSISGDNDTVRAAGQVRACFGRYALQTPILEYERRRGVLRADAAFKLYGLDNKINGDSLYYNVAEQRGEMENANISIGEEGLHVTGKKVRLQGEIYEADDVEISSCKEAERDWYLRAESVSYQNKKTVARNLWFYVRDAPVLYLPWLTIHNTGEKYSGFLWPDVKYGNRDGAQIALPYYWYLADNYDATLTPRWLSEQGVSLDGEIRYLTAAHMGEIMMSWTPFEEEDRARQYFKHAWTGGDWRAEAEVDNISDDAYFADFSNDAALLAKRNLSRRLAVEYERDGWHGRLAVESFKTFNYNGTPPHDLLPQLQVWHDGGWEDYQWHGEWEYGRFVANQAGQDESGRWLWRGGIARRLAFGEGAIYPEVGAHMVKYDNGQAAFLTPYLRTRMESGYRSLPLAMSYQLQAAYAFAPETNQRNAPLFDTELRELSAGGIYEWNRFSGGDRAADVHVLAYGVEVRSWDAANSRERLAVEIAQRYYFRRPRLTLPDESAPPERGFANLFAALRVRPDHRWKAEADAEWNPAADKLESAYVDVRADFGGRRLLRLGGSFEEDESITWGGTLPLGARLDGGLLMRHLLADDITEYHAALVLRAACGCWRLFVGINNLIAGTGKTKQSYSVGFEFKGLGTVSSDSYEKIAKELR